MGSQYDQDKWVISVLNGKRDGYFLDSGAGEGELLSNTYKLEKEYGWRGICVEPNDEIFGYLNNGTRNAHRLKGCLYSHNGEVDFAEAYYLGGIIGHVSMGAVNSEPPHRRNFGKKLCFTPETVLRMFDAPDIIDYWSLDTEGSELAILNAFPWDRYKVAVLTIERHNPAAIKQLLENKNYRFACEIGCDDCYVNNELIS